jgi:hypothetical protein
MPHYDYFQNSDFVSKYSKQPAFTSISRKQNPNYFENHGNVSALEKTNLTSQLVEYSPE